MANLQPHDCRLAEFQILMNELFLGKYMNDENYDNERLLETLEYVLYDASA